MSKKLIYLALVLAFCMASSLQAQTIIWVSDNKNPTDNIAADQGWVDMLEANGYTEEEMRHILPLLFAFPGP